VALTDTAIRAATPRDRDYKLAGGGGLYLPVTKAAGKLWHMKYRAHGVERKLALGKYPDVAVSAWLKAHDGARAKVGSGEDPAAAKRRVRVSAKLAAGTTFGAVALEYIATAKRKRRAPATIDKLHWPREWLQPAIGHRPVDQVEPHKLLAALKRQKGKGYLEPARRNRAFAGRVFCYAVTRARAQTDPAALLLGAVALPKPRRRQPSDHLHQWASRALGYQRPHARRAPGRHDDRAHWPV
jgi:hypothetical protein